MAADSVPKILLIDDSSTGHDTLQRMVRSFSGRWELDWAETYAAGLKRLLTNKYAVCLLDYHLDEGRDGLQLLNEAHQAENATPGDLPDRRYRSGT